VYTYTDDIHHEHEVNTLKEFSSG